MKNVESVKQKAAKARDAIHEVCREFAPAGRHAIGAGREILLAMREVIDAEIRLLDRGKAPKAGVKAATRKRAAKKVSVTDSKT